MREAVFLRQNTEKWKRYATQPATDPDELAARFVELTDDLSYARTFYPDSTTTQYLNELTGKLHQAVYKNKRENTGRFGHFWLRELPLLVAQSYRPLLWALAFFCLASAVGALSAAYDDTFVRVILGDQYVNQTLNNIRRGDPMAIYKSAGQTEMFIGITINNIYVALRTFAMGALLSFGSAWSLFTNGVMLGAFQYFFFAQGVGAQSVLTIWIHGTLEISAIVLAGGAGFVMGNSLLFPGTYSRADSFRRGARTGLKLAIGIVPIFVVAGFLEGFVTRHTEMPLALSLLIIGSSLFFILGYFVVYPWWLHQQADRVS